MANGRNPKKRGHDSSRDAGGFVALPWAVLDSLAYLGLSVHAKALLLDVARSDIGELKVGRGGHGSCRSSGRSSLPTAAKANQAG